jgi:AbiJ N-terminal domain 4
MTVFDLFSKRRKAERGGQGDVYVYDKIPNGLRVQIIHIWTDAIGNPNVYGSDNAMQAYQEIVEILRREYQVFVLTNDNRQPHDHRFAFAELCAFFLAEKNTERAIDVIELTAKVIDHVTRSWNHLNRQNADQIATEALNELNTRFKENGIGYEFSDGQIIRIDNQLAHAEIVKPALQILRGKGYANAQKEFLDAHESYRHGKHAEALVNCNKAFESTMKIICSKRKWSVSPNATASELIKVCYDNGLIPTFWQTQFAGLRSVLESGIPTARNRLGGHGAGAAPSSVIPESLVAYVLHLTASTILFLATAEEKLP